LRVERHEPLLLIVPARFALRVNILRKRITPFIDFNTGYDALINGSSFENCAGVELSGGLKLWVSHSVAATFRIGYNFDLIFVKELSGLGDFSRVPFMFGIEF